jgi:hypothetical protein
MLLCFTATAPVVAQKAADDKPTATATPADTDKAVKAKRVSTRIAVHLDPAQKEIRYALDDERNSIGHKAAGALFSTSSDVMVTYPFLNPLSVQVTASVSEAEDPTHSAITQIIAAIAGVPGLVNPDLAKAAADVGPRTASLRDATPAEKCPELIEAERVLRDIQNGLFGSTVSAKNIGDQYKSWVTAFQTASSQSGGGPKAAKDTADLINEFYETVNAAADKAAEAIKLAQERSNATPLPTKAQQAYNEFLAKLLAGKTQADQTKALADNKAELDRLRAAADDSLPCVQDALNLYRLISIANPQVRLADVRKFEKAIADLRDVLRKTYEPETGWFNKTEYVVAKDIVVSPGKLARVVVKTATIKVESADATLVATPQDAASASFDVREYTNFVPELGIGATFAVLERPKYGTSTNAQGQMVVSRAGKTGVSFSPTVMVNFVPVGLSGSVPIIQVGASTSTSAPAVFLGGGWRLPGTTGKSGVVVGLGLVLGWVKDLQTLVPEQSVVTGTKDIENDQKFDPKPRPGLYLNLQYKF